MILQSFFETGFYTIPESLEPRERGRYYIMGLLIFTSFILLALARKKNGRFLQVLFQLLTAGGNLDQRLKDTIKPGSYISILLTLNYTLMFSVCCYLSFTYLHVLEKMTLVVVSAALPLLIMFIQLFPVFLVTGVTGMSLPVNTLLANNFIGGQIGGVILLLVALLWSLNPLFGDQAFLAFVVLVGMVQITRLFKNSLLLLGIGVKWYYILLYFCTLEILPLFVAYYYVMLNFSI